MKIAKIVTSGVGPTANTGHIALRQETAGTGPLAYYLHVRSNASAEVYTIDAPFPDGLLLDGLYMDTQTNAWANNSWMTIYTA